MVLERIHDGPQMGTFLEEDRLEPLVFDLCLIERDHRMESPMTDNRVNISKDFWHVVET